MDLLNLISNRKSVRKYLDKHIPDEDLKSITNKNDSKKLEERFWKPED